ncbi:MAG: hypothetical protein WA869_14145 [Alloacidobacterium sp.]
MADESLPLPRQRHLKEKAFEEFKRLIVIFLYLWVVFALLSVYKSIVLLQSHLDYPEHSFALINAFICAKVLLIGEHFHLGTRFKDKPLVYPILHKCFVFTVLLVCFHIVESVILGVWHGNTIVDSIPPILGGSVQGLFSVGVVCFVVLLPFFGFREIGEVIGHKELWTLIFTRRGNDLRLT